MMLLPLGRTPMDKKSAQSMEEYAKKVGKILDDVVPWQKQETGGRLRAALRGKVKPGEIVVVLDAGETSTDPLFKNAKVIREK